MCCIQLESFSFIFMAKRELGIRLDAGMTWVCWRWSWVLCSLRSLFCCWCWGCVSIHVAVGILVWS
jgi:hypothetical protein